MTLQRMLAVERNEAIQSVKQFVLDQVVLELASLGSRLDPAVTDNALPPGHIHIIVINCQHTETARFHLTILKQNPK